MPLSLQCGDGLELDEQPRVGEVVDLDDSARGQLVDEELRACRDDILEFPHVGRIDDDRHDVVERAASQGDAVAIEVLDNAGYYLGLAVANAIAALAPEVVILGGGNCKPGGIFWNAIERTARAHCHVTEIDRIVFTPASLGYEAGVIGAAIWGKKVAAGEVVPKR